MGIKALRDRERKPGPSYSWGTLCGGHAATPPCVCPTLRPSRRPGSLEAVRQGVADPQRRSSSESQQAPLWLAEAKPRGVMFWLSSPHTQLFADAQLRASQVPGRGQ